MSLIGNWKSKDDKYSLNIEEGENGNYPINITMPVAKGAISGLLKNGQVANLSFEVNNTVVFVYLFVSKNGNDELLIRGTGRSTGRFKGDIPETVCLRVG